MPRLVMGAGVEVAVRRGDLVLTPLTPVPGLRVPMVLHPDDPEDPRVYRIVYPQYGWSLGVVFTEDTPPRLLLDLMSFEKRRDWENPRQWVRGAAAAGAATAALGLSRKRPGARRGAAGCGRAGKRRGRAVGRGWRAGCARTIAATRYR